MGPETRSILSTFVFGPTANGQSVKISSLKYEVRKTNKMQQLDVYY